MKMASSRISLFLYFLATFLNAFSASANWSPLYNSVAATYASVPGSGFSESSSFRAASSCLRKRNQPLKRRSSGPFTPRISGVLSFSRADFSQGVTHPGRMLSISAATHPRSTGLRGRFRLLVALPCCMVIHDRRGGAMCRKCEPSWRTSYVKLSVLR